VRILNKKSIRGRNLVGGADENEDEKYRLSPFPTFWASTTANLAQIHTCTFIRTGKECYYFPFFLVIENEVLEFYLL
jgi:hypothetical protein